MAKIPIALELYSVRHDLARDTAGTLRAVAQMGYDGVEFAGNPQNPADELRDLLRENGLRCCGWHTPWQLAQDDRLDGTIAFHKTVGNPNIIIPGLPGDMTRTRADWLRNARLLDRLAEKLIPHGMATGYHNHSAEFQPLEGELPWDTLFGNTGRGVIMQLDTGNALHGGADILGILRKYPGRATTVHLKPYSKTAARESAHAGFRPVIGEDEVPWDEVFRLCETLGGTEWYIVEYESDAYPPLEAVERCLKSLRAMGK
jgi:sugar phosphate isomerase/epimerase